MLDLILLVVILPGHYSDRKNLTDSLHPQMVSKKLVEKKNFEMVRLEEQDLHHPCPKSFATLLPLPHVHLFELATEVDHL